MRTPYGGRYSRGVRPVADSIESSALAMSCSDLPGREAQQVAMAVAVERDLVAGVGDLAGERGVAPDLLADEEERRPDLVRGEDLEHGRRALGVRPVVEGERVALPVEVVSCTPRGRRRGAQAPASAGSA